MTATATDAFDLIATRAAALPLAERDTFLREALAAAAAGLQVLHGPVGAAAVCYSLADTLSTGPVP